LVFLGNGAIGLYVGSADFSFSSDLDVDGCELDNDDGSAETGFWWVDSGGLDTWGLKI